MALKESNDNKAPGPDGLNFKWLKILWLGIEQKVKEFFEKFYSMGDIRVGANSSFISLISKVKEAKYIGGKGIVMKIDFAKAYDSVN